MIPISRLDFWAPWCGPCRMISPIVEELSKEYEGKWLIAKCNVDESTDIPMKFGIRNIPTLLFFKGGVMKEKMVGSTTKAAIVAKMNSIDCPPDRCCTGQRPARQGLLQPRRQGRTELFQHVRHG